MKRFLLSAALLLACSGVALAQESEFSGGGGGGITAAPGSGTAGRVPQFASTTSLEDSKMTTSGTNSGTWTLYDPTLVNGETKLVLRAGVAQSTSAPIFEVLDAAGDSLSGGDGVMQFVSGQAGVGARFYEVTSSAQDWSLGPNIFSMKSTYELRWSDGAFFYGSIDTGLARSAAGILAVTDGSTGQGGIGIADAAINSVSDALILRHATSGTAAASFGTGLLFQGEDGAGNMQDMASIDAVYTDATNGSEDADVVLRGFKAGAELEFMRFREGYMGTVASISINSIGGSIDLRSAGPLYISPAGLAAGWVVNDPALAPYYTNTYDIGTSSALVRKIYAVTSGVQTANGAESNVKTISESITLATGGLTTDSTADLLPANSLILSVVARITTTITTTTDWALGDASEAARFASANATLTAGTTAVGLNHQKGGVATDAAGPVQTAAAKLRITCSGANPGAGTIRVTVTYLELTPPSS